jgi:CoA:oxalate CoA-transferase
MCIRDSFQAFRAADGMLVIAAGNDALWQALCTALEAPALAADPRFATNPERSAHAAALEAEIEAILGTRRVADWLQRLEAHGVPAGPLNRVSEALQSPQVAARTMLVETALRGGMPLKVAGNPVKLSTHADSPSRDPAPALDQHRQSILSELGRA